MIKIIYEYDGIEKYVYAKLEYFNLTGSIKDRVAYYILDNAKKSGELQAGMPIIEVTSGNTGISLAALGRYYNHPVYIFMPDWVSKERVKLIGGYGAEVILISKEEGGFLKCLEESRKLALENDGFLANQFASKYNFLAHYETTAEEILSQVKEDCYGFVSGVGTGGTLMGVGKRLKEINPNMKAIAIEPDKMPMISEGRIIEEHKIEGIGDDFVPDLVNRELIDDIFLINDDDAVNMARKLSKELGLGVGISSGANLIGCILAQNKHDIPMVTVFPDDNKKYLSTDLSRPICDDEAFVSNKIKLKRYEIV
ncbi:MAG: cysteine synthase family protein [Clostridia bacterium]|nr:cysteine synthase family protein [Clostridia bacterium]MBQ8300244.1 cysteine synthase family protein [Clostridia bacterium]